jgi:O-methyltransferase
MKRIIIFGASGGGQRLTKEIEEWDEPYQIIAYADNDPQLQGTALFNKPFIAPSDIKEIDFDGIIIASAARDSIYDQLTNNLEIESDKIIPYDSYRERARITALKNVSRLIYENNIPGNVAELGVFRGEFARHINKCFPDRILYLFDTFEGFAESDIKQEIKIESKRFAKHSYFFSDTNIDMVLGKMPYPDRCVVKKGYFPESITGLEDNFSYVSIDTDLYKPALEGLKYFYPRLTGDGVIFVDDFFSVKFTGIRRAVHEFGETTKLHILPLGDDNGIGIVKA